MNTSDLMKAMADAGAPFDAILIAVRALEEKDAEITRRDNEAAEKRAKDAERKRLERSGRVHGQSTDSPEKVQDVSTPPSLPLPPNENKSNPSTPTNPEKQTPRTRKGARLSADWMPAPFPEDLAEAVAKWPPGTVDRELARLRDWAASAPGAKGVKSDWDATWRNWIRKIEDEGRYGNGNSRNNAGPYPARNGGKPKDGAIAACDRRLGLDGSIGEQPRHDDRAGSGDRGCTLAAARMLL